jgi:type II secretory pathway component GspD/PulD (secretin)
MKCHAAPAMDKGKGKLERQKARLQEILRQQAELEKEKARLQPMVRQQAELEKTYLQYQAQYQAEMARLVERENARLLEIERQGGWKVVRLLNAKAAEVSRILNELFSKNEERGLRLAADERTNCILLQGRAPDVEAMEDILRRLDKLAAKPSRKQDKGH